MKHFRTLCASVLLIVAFTVTAYAGNITTFTAQPLPKPAPNGNITTFQLENSSSQGEIEAQVLQFIAVHHVSLY